MSLISMNSHPDNETFVRTLNPKPLPFHARACDECKRQKMRCSSFADFPQACERCRQRNQPCEFTDKYKRRTKRRQKKERQEEGSRREPIQPVETSPPHSPSIEEVTSRSPRLHQAVAQNMIPVSNSDKQFQRLDFDSQLHVSSVKGLDENAGNNDARALQGVEVSKVEINETFVLFFKDFSPHLTSFLDPSLSPDKYFCESPLLFWTIVAIGSRQYLQNPTLLSALAGPVSDLLWATMMQTDDSICSLIESLVLLATWTFPFKTVFNDMTFTLSGMAVSLAMQTGLHLPVQSQDFALKTIGSLFNDCSKRANLWVNCVLCHTRAAAACGQPALASLDSTIAMLMKENLLRYIPNETHHQLRLMSLSASASKAVFECDFNGNGDAQSVMTTLIGLEAAFGEMEVELDGHQDQEQLYFHIARLQMRVYYLAQSSTIISTSNLSKLYQDSIDIIRLCKNLEDSTQLSLSCPTYIWLMLGLSACTLLKILSKPDVPDRSSIIHSRGRLSYFTAIALLKKVSIESDDGPGRLARALTQLWTNKKVADTVEPNEHVDDLRTPRTQLRTRLSMSLFYETLQRYREEYGGQRFVDSLAPRAIGNVHSTLTSDSAVLPRTDSTFIDEYFQVRDEDMDLNQIMFDDWIPIDDNEFTTLALSSLEGPHQATYQQ